MFNSFFLKNSFILFVFVFVSVCTALWIMNLRIQNLAYENKKLVGEITAKEEANIELDSENAGLNEQLNKFRKSFELYNNTMNQAFQERYEDAQHYKELHDEIRKILTTDNCSGAFVNSHVVERLRVAASAAGKASPEILSLQGSPYISDKSD